ncbi:hypothetical protein BJX62DRAFT_214511, partial [Aspergillus germanicus]
MLHSPHSARSLPNHHRVPQLFHHSAEASGFKRLTICHMRAFLLAAPCWATPEASARALPSKRNSSNRVRRLFNVAHLRSF